MGCRRLASDKKGALERGATLVFIDESGFSQRPEVRRTWSPKGKTPILKHHFNWGKISSIAGIICQPDGSQTDLFLHLQRDSIKSDSIIDYIIALREQVPGPITLLWDGLTAHRSKIVKEHIRNQQDWLVVERFPSYAPELNPVEYLWAKIKNKDIASYCPDTLNELEQKLEDAAKRIHTRQYLLSGFLIASGLFVKIPDVVLIE